MGVQDAIKKPLNENTQFQSEFLVGALGLNPLYLCINTPVGNHHKFLCSAIFIM